MDTQLAFVVNEIKLLIVVYLGGFDSLPRSKGLDMMARTQVFSCVENADAERKLADLVGKTVVRSMDYELLHKPNVTGTNIPWLQKWSSRPTRN